MRRRLRPEEARLWSLVAATVRRSTPGRTRPADADTLEADLRPRTEAEPGAATGVIVGRDAAVRPHLRPPRTPLRPSAEALAELAAGGVGARPTPRPPARAPGPDPGPIEPNRKRRIARAREPIGGRLDLHGYDQDQARAALHDFVLAAQADGARAVLVITGKGRTGGGVLRARVPEWLGEAPARTAVAGVSPAEARHGGEGALYVALKRR